MLESYSHKNGLSFFILIHTHTAHTCVAGDGYVTMPPIDHGNLAKGWSLFANGEHAWLQSPSGLSAPCHIWTRVHLYYLPQMMSRAQSVTWLKQLNGPFPACFSSFSTRMLACSFITSRKSARIEKWKVGVNIFLRLRHFEPVLIEREEVRVWDFGKGHTWNCPVLSSL